MALSLPPLVEGWAPCPSRLARASLTKDPRPDGRVIDLLTGLVLSVIGVSQDIQVLAIVGVLLLLSGGGMLAYVVWQRNKPDRRL